MHTHLHHQQRKHESVMIQATLGETRTELYQLIETITIHTGNDLGHTDTPVSHSDYHIQYEAHTMQTRPHKKGLH